MSGDAKRILSELAGALATRPVAAVARDSGLSRAGVYKALADGSRPSLDTAERLAAALGYRLVLRRTGHSPP